MQPALAQPGDALAEAERQLVQRVRRGDRQAFGELVHLHQDGVFNVCYRLMGDRGEAEDMVQESFVRAYDKLEQFDASRPFGPWIRRLANVCLNRLSQRRPESVALEGPWTHPAGEETLPEPSALRAERADRIRAAILALPPHYRAVVELRHFQHLSYSEIAVALGIPLSDVKSHLFRARKALARWLADEMEG